MSKSADQNLNRAEELSFESSSCLMQDAVATDTLGVLAGEGSRVALYANPYEDGKEEALVVDEQGVLTWMTRAADEVGWRQVDVLDAGGAKITASEVVVVVSPRDLTLWAVYVDNTGALKALKFERTEGRSTWVPQSHAFPNVTKAQNLSVMYNERTAFIIGLDKPSGAYFRIGVAPSTVRHLSSATVIPLNIPGPIDGLLGGMVTHGEGHTAYVLSGHTLTRRDGNAAHEAVVATDVARLVGVYGVRTSHGDCGCVYLDTTGALCTFHRVSGEFSKPVRTRTELGLDRAISWVDANGLLHVYGIDRSGAMKVLHQAAWGVDVAPVWSHSVTDKGVRVPACVGIFPDVVQFAVDAFPDNVPNQLVKLAKVPTAEQYVLCSQDITTTRWTKEKVRLVAEPDQAPSFVTHYVSEVTLANAAGTPMPRQSVSVTADSLVEIVSGGASYLVGPGHSATLRTNVMGRLSIAMDADSLVPPTLQLSAIGAQGGLSIQPAADVHNYLDGSGSLGSQKGRFDGAALEASGISDKTGPELATAAGQITNAFKVGRGLPPKSLLWRGAGPAPDIHGYAVGKNADGTLTHYEFANAAEAEAHLAAIRARPDYGGIWDDFVNFASDVWEGIKTGVIEVVDASVTAVANVFIRIGGLVVELAHFVVDTVVKAVHMAQVFFRTITDSVGKVVEWLKALFDFHDIWDTKTALQAGIKTINGYGRATFRKLSDVEAGWFAAQEEKVKETFTELRARFRGNRCGDFQNQTPPMSDPTGNAITRKQLRTNVQGSWMLNQVHASTTRHSASFTARHLGDTPADRAFASILSAFETSGMGAHLATAAGDLEALTKALFDPNQPDSAAGSSVVPLLDLAERVILAALEGMDALVATVLGFLETLIENVDQILAIPLDFGPVNALYHWIRKEATGLDNPVDMTVGDLFFLIASFFVTPMYKLIYGVDAAPFPGGVFPRIPAPDWHTDHDPSFRMTAEDQAALIKLQIACGSCGLAAGILEGITDLYPLFTNDTDPPGWGDIVLGGASLVLNGLMFNSVLWCPPVTGSAWTVNGAPTYWTMAFAFSWIIPAFGAGALGVGIAAKVNKWPGYTSILKNVGAAMAGPPITTLISLPVLIFGAIACGVYKSNAYSTAWNMLGCIPGTIQVVRVGKSLPLFPYRAGGVATVDALCTIISASMVIAGAAWAGPEILSAGLPNGKVGTPYSYKIPSSGGTQPFDGPLKWAISGDLPMGMWFDTGTGTLHGTPETGGYYPVVISLQDSFGPPKVAAPMHTRLSIGYATVAEESPRA